MTWKKQEDSMLKLYAKNNKDGEVEIFYSLLTPFMPLFFCLLSSIIKKYTHFFMI